MWLRGHTFLTLELKNVLHLLFQDSKNRSQILLPRFLLVFFVFLTQPNNRPILMVTFAREHELTVIPYSLGFVFLH